MKRLNITLIIATYILVFSQSSFAQDGLILPMPGQTPKQSTPANQNKTQQTNQPTTNSNRNNTNTKKADNDKSGIIIPLPTIDKNNQQNNKPKQEKPVVNNHSPKPNKPVNVNTEPLIAIPSMDSPKKTNPIPPAPPAQPTQTTQPTAKKQNKTPAKKTTFTAESNEAFLSDFSNDIDDFPSPDSQITSSEEGSSVDNILPPAEADTTVTQNASGENITIYPKDSGSAIFMVMKSWQCQDYDAASLINQALEVYGKESADTFQINGIENIAKEVKVTVEEEDITFDELLDILGSKTGNDWGCDIVNKTIYIYPKGIKTESYVSWE